MATVTGDFSLDFSGLSNQNPYTNDDLVPLLASSARIDTGAFRSVDNNTSAIFMLDPEKYVPDDVITSKIEISTIGSGLDGITCGVVDEDGNGYRIYVYSWGISRHRIDAWAPHYDSGAEVSSFSPATGDTFEVEYNTTTGALVVKRNGSTLSGAGLTNSTHADKDLAPYFGQEPGDNGAGGILSFAADGVESASGSPPVISSATPSGSIGTANTATVGCTTDTEEGTLYAVLSETNNVSTATDSQIKAGQNSASAAADFADDAAVADSTPEVAFSGLDPETTYYYALVQETTEGFSNVLSGSFTTAAAAIVATKLQFTAQPGNTVVGQTMSAVQVAAVDDDNELDTDFDGDVTIALQTGDGTLLGTLTQAAVAGLATFDDLSIRTLNEDAVLRATADGLTSADSDEFDITAGGGGGSTGMPSSSRLGGLLQ